MLRQQREDLEAQFAAASAALAQSKNPNALAYMLLADERDTGSDLDDEDDDDDEEDAAADDDEANADPAVAEARKISRAKRATLRKSRVAKEKDKQEKAAANEFKRRASRHTRTSQRAHSNRVSVLIACHCNDSVSAERHSSWRGHSG